MNLEKNNQKQFILKENTIFNTSFNSFGELEKFGKNFSFMCKYRFGTGDFFGEYNIHQYKEFQIARVQYNEGMMYSGYAPKDTITIVVIVENEGNLCINRIKMQQHEVLVFDSKKKYEIIFSKPLIVGVISLQKSFVSKYCPSFLDILDSTFKDTELALGNIIKTLHDKANNITKTEMIEALHVSFNSQDPIYKKLTLGEKKAFEIRDCILKELENDVNINSLVNRARISDKTLQTGFKTLFGFPPKRFINILRLNLAYRDLSQSHSNETTVTKISSKWGFKHSSRFSQEYRDIFGELPSETLAHAKSDSHIQTSCLY